MKSFVFAALTMLALSVNGFANQAEPTPAEAPPAPVATPEPAVTPVPAETPAVEAAKVSCCCCHQVKVECKKSVCERIAEARVKRAEARAERAACRAKKAADCCCEKTLVEKAVTACVCCEPVTVVKTCCKAAAKSRCGCNKCCDACKKVIVRTVHRVTERVYVK